MPDPQQQNAGIPAPPPTPDVKNTTADKIGSVLGAVSQGGLLGSISDAIEKHHQKRLAEAQMDHDVMAEKATKLAQTPKTDPGYQQLQQDYDIASARYEKSVGQTKEIKDEVKKRKLIADHHIAQQQQKMGGPPPGIPQASAASAAPQASGQPPQAQAQPPAPAPAPAPAQDAASGAAPSATPTVGPPITPPPAPRSWGDVTAGIPAEQQGMADARAAKLTQQASDIEQKRQIAVEQAKPPSATAASKTTPQSDAYFSLLDQVDPKTGQKYLPQDALKIVTQAATKAGKPTPFEEYMADPKNYEKFEKETAEAKQSKAKNASTGAVYAIYRMMEAGYKNNPEILPLVASIAPQVFANAGMKVPPGLAEALGKVPLDQPLSPVTGQPIGTSMPSAPTGGTRTAAQSAIRALPIITELRQQIKDSAQSLGPISGRVSVKYLLGKAGSTGDPQKDKELSSLRTNLALLSTLTAKFHINSVRAMTKIEELADAGKDSSAAIGGFLDEVEKRAKDTQAQESGYGESGEPRAPAAGETNKNLKNTPPPSPSNAIDDEIMKLVKPN